MTFIEFMINRIGSKWIVLDRRTEKMRRRWAGWNILTRGRYKKLKAEYTALTGKRPF